MNWLIEKNNRIEQIKDKVVEEELERLHELHIKLNFPDEQAKQILKKAWKYTIEDTVELVIKEVRNDLMKQTTLTEEIYYYFKKEWGLK